MTTDRIEDHPLHEEPFVVDRAVMARVAAARAAGRRVVAVGTTMVRLLEELGPEPRRPSRRATAAQGGGRRAGAGSGDPDLSDLSRVAPACSSRRDMSSPRSTA